MYLLNKRADELEAADIKRLVENSVQESKSLDYKKELKIEDKDKREFLFDISSMSNTDGGCLIYGIEEKKDASGHNTGTPKEIVGITIENFDKLKQQIEDIIRGNTEPGISNIALKRVTVDRKDILIIGIPKTFGLPIMVTYNSTNKFYRRNNSGKYAVDVYELYQMFMENQVLKESAEKFRLQRIEKVRALKVFPNLDIDTSFFIHIIPFSFQNEKLLDLTNARQMDGLSVLMEPFYSHGWDTIFNVDGFATWDGSANGDIISYNQILRNSVYEIYTAGLLNVRRAGGNDYLILDEYDFIPDVVKKVNAGISVLREFHVEPPFLISFSIINVKGAFISSFHSPRLGRPFTIDELYLPPVILPTFESEIYKHLKPVFDIIWQAVSVNRSPDYKPEN